MNIELKETEEFLQQFDYNYLKKEQQLIVILEFSQRVYIDFSNPKKLEISDKLMGWNFLTGMIQMSIKKALLCNFILGITLSYGISFYNSSTSLFFFFAYFLWIYLWSVFYLSKSENLKDILINWNN